MRVLRGRRTRNGQEPRHDGVRKPGRERRGEKSVGSGRQRRGVCLQAPVREPVPVGAGGCVYLHRPPGGNGGAVGLEW